MPRHRLVMSRGVPKPYTEWINPLPRTAATVKMGAVMYEARCVSCHGETGQGDGVESASLSPPPANLLAFSAMPMSRWDPFLFWTVAEGGGPFGTAMPAFKDQLTRNEIWAVSAFIQAHLPTAPAAP